MKKIILLVFAIGYFFPSMASQGHLSDSIVSPKDKTVYNFKKQPVSCVDNLENLFDSWPLFNRIINAEELELISYTSYGAIRDTAQINHYAYLMTQWDSPFLSIAGYQSNESDGHYFKILEKNTMKDIYEDALSKGVAAAVVKKALDDELLMARKSFSQVIKIGYRVFSIKIKFHKKIVENFIFCDPKTFEVVVDFLFKNLYFDAKNVS